MYLLNKADITENRPDIFECYDVTFEDQDYNKRKLDELLSYCNPDLNNNLVFSSKINHSRLMTGSPLYYPISTLLLVYFSRDNWQENVDSKIAEYITSLFTLYDPTDLFSIYNSIKDDEELKNIESESLLTSHLEEGNKDIAIFRDVFKRLNFSLLYSYSIGNYKSFTTAVKSMKLFKPDVMAQYFTLDTAFKNTETLKLLKLTPNIKNQ